MFLFFKFPQNKIVICECFFFIEWLSLALFSLITNKKYTYLVSFCIQTQEEKMCFTDILQYISALIRAKKACDKSQNPWF